MKDKDYGMSMGKSYGGMSGLKDNTQASGVKSISTNSEQYDLKRIDPASEGSKGYPAQAWKYDY